MVKPTLLLFIVASCSALGFSLINGCSHYRPVANSTTAVFSLEASKPAALLPRSRLLSPQGYRQVRLSPDGRWLSFKQRTGAAEELFVAPPNNLRAAMSISESFKKPIGDYRWSFLPNILLFRADGQGDKNHRWYQVNVNTLKFSAIANFGKDVTALITLFVNNPSKILLSTYAGDSQEVNAFQIDLPSGKKTHLPDAKHWNLALYDHHFRLRVGCKYSLAAQFECYDVSGVRPSLIVRLPSGVSGFNGFLANTGDFVYSLPATNTKPTSMTAYRFADKAQQRLVTATQGRLSFPLPPYLDVYKHESLLNTLAVTEALVDPQQASLLKQRLAFVGEILGSEHVEILSRTLDDSQWLMFVDDLTGSPRYVLLDTVHFKLQTLLYRMPQLQMHLADPMMPIAPVTQEGFALPSYFSAPLDQIIKTGKHRFKTLKPLPTVLLVESDSTKGRANYQYNKIVQWFTNRGYGVLQVNDRGSSGVGAPQRLPTIDAFAKNRHQDRLVALDWSIRQGLVDPARVAIIGSGYGTYTAAASLSLTPERFACGVDVLGSLLTASVTSRSDDGRAGTGFWHEIAYDAHAPSSRQGLQRFSSWVQAEHIRRPLLILQAASDPKDQQHVSKQINNLIQRNKGQVAYALYPDQGQSANNPAHFQLGYALVENFLAKHLGGRAEPIQPDERTGFGVQIKAGDELIPSMNQAQTKIQQQAIEPHLAVEQSLP